MLCKLQRALIEATSPSADPLPPAQPQPPVPLKELVATLQVWWPSKGKPLQLDAACSSEEVWESGSPGQLLYLHCSNADEWRQQSATALSCQAQPTTNLDARHGNMNLL